MDTPRNAQIYGHGITNLLKEYASKLAIRLDDIRKYRESLRGRKNIWTHSDEWANADEWQMHRIMFENLRHSLLTLTREASQLAEQGAVDDITRIELRLRLAEVEGLIQAIETVLSNDRSL